MSEINISSIEKKGRLLILLIEDYSTILNVHKAFFEKMSFAVDTAIAGEQAFTRVNIYCYPVVILDGGLPDMTGLELTLKTREYEKTTDISYALLILLS